MELGNLSTLLGTLTGFAGVMLALSLVASALAQTVQSLLKLRGRADMVALVTQLGGKRELPTQVMYFAPPQWVGSSPRRRRWAVALIGPKYLRLSKKHFDEHFSDQDYDEFVLLARQVLTKWMRWVSLGCAIVVAFGLQVSATALLQRLSTDAELRQQALGIANAQLESEDVARAVESDVAAARTLVEELSAEYPFLEEWSGDATDAADARAELVLVLEGQPEGPAILQRFDTHLEERTQSKAASLSAASDDALSQLALIDIHVLSDLSYYVGTQDGRLRWQNIIGTFITAIMLTFGAPFWYEKLRAIGAIGPGVKRVLGPEGK